MRAANKAYAHLESALRYLGGFGMTSDTEESKSNKRIKYEMQKNSEYEAYQRNKQKSKRRLEAIYGRGASSVAGIVYFAEITNLSRNQKIYCVGELHGNQKADTDYLTQYKQLLTANDKSEDPDRIDFFIEDNNFPTDALIINKHISSNHILSAEWIDKLRIHLRGCYASLEDIEYITGKDSTALSDQLTTCPYKHTHVHWADPGYFGILWSKSKNDLVSGMSYQENPEWLIEAHTVQLDFRSKTTLTTFKQQFPHIAAHLEANQYMQSEESNLYDIIEANPYIADQLRRSIYRGSLFRTWFENATAKEKQIRIDQGLIEGNDYWWRVGIFSACRRAMDIYTFLRMTRGSMSARGRFKNVIVHAGVRHGKSIVSLFRFVESDHTKLSIIERDKEKKFMNGEVPFEMAKMKIDLCKAISFEKGSTYLRKFPQSTLMTFPSVSPPEIPTTRRKRRRMIIDDDHDEND